MNRTLRVGNFEGGEGISQTEPERAPIRLRTDPEQIPNGSRMDTEWFPNEPRTTPNGPRTDLKQTSSEPWEQSLGLLNLVAKPH